MKNYKFLLLNFTIIFLLPVNWLFADNEFSIRLAPALVSPLGAEAEPLGTGGALFKIDGLTEDFILINGDVFFDIDFSRMIDFNKRNAAFASLAVHPNNHPFDSALIISDNNNKVIGWLNK